MASKLVADRKLAKKDKNLDKANILNEFKGLNSLLQSTETPTKKIKLSKSELKIDTHNVDETIKTNVEEQNTETKTLADEKIAEKRKITKKNYILIENLNEGVTVDDMQTYLSDNGISFNKVIVSPGSIGIANFLRPTELEKLFNVCQGVRYKTNELFIFKSNIDKVDSKSVSNLCETSVHLKNIDACINDEDIIALLPESSVKSVSLNQENGTAIIDFVDNESARASIELLHHKLMGEKVVRASFLVKSQRPDVFTLKVLNLPKGVANSDVTRVFPSVTKAKLSKKKPGQCMIHFKSAEDMESVLNGENEYFIGDNKLAVEQLGTRKVKKVELTMQYVLNLFNLPFDFTVAEIKDNYPDARYVEMVNNDNGMFSGAARLMYNEKVCCEEALKKSKGLVFKHRRVRAEMKLEETTRDIAGRKTEESSNQVE